MSEIRISLDAEDFKTLIAGGTVNKDLDKVKIFLKDIGYSVMYEALYQEMAGKGFVMVQPAEASKDVRGDIRTHELVKCKNEQCNGLLTRKVGEKYPAYCSNCYRALDHTKIVVKKKVKKS